MFHARARKKNRGKPGFGGTPGSASRKRLPRLRIAVEHRAVDLP
jgi:hypothetical protein